METLITLLVIYVVYQLLKSFIKNAIKDHRHQTTLNLIKNGDMKVFTKYVDKHYK